jgi:hypothetical protein
LDGILEQATMLHALHVNLSNPGAPIPCFDYAPNIEKLLIGCRHREWDIKMAGSLEIHQNLKMVVLDAEKSIFNLVQVGH